MRGKTVRVPQLIRTQWREWTAIVALFAQRHARRDRITNKKYEALHGGLLARCQEMLASPDEGSAVYERMVDLLRPWRSVESLDAAEVEIAVRLFNQCREVQRVLGDRPLAARQGGSRLLAALVGGLVIAVAAMLINTPNFSPTNPRWWSVAARRSWQSLVQTVGASGHAWILGGGILAVGLAILLVWTSRGRR